MLRIGVISDTHLPDTGESAAFLIDLYEQVLAPVDMILHAGDLVAASLLSVFGKCPVYAVRGNMDAPSQGIPQKRIVDAGDFRIGLIHGWGPGQGLAQRVLKEFRGTPIDCLVFGHSHRPYCAWHDKVLLFNPGSATDRRSMPYHSVGLLEVDQEIRGTIIRVD